MAAKTNGRKKKANGKKTENEFTEKYNRYKFYDGKQYTGMPVGKSHKWYYDKGEWHDVKITPDLWEIEYSVTKRRAGRAPEGAGVPVGTGYHWFILAHQIVKKLNLDDYTTSMSGLKFKLAHKRADKGKWSATAKTQRAHLIDFLKDIISQLEKEPLPLEFEYKDDIYKGEAFPIEDACVDGKCYQYDITLNDEHIGIIRSLKSGWKMHGVDDNGFIRAIGKNIELARGDEALTKNLDAAVSKRKKAAA
jgi:hypothetical protein